MRTSAMILSRSTAWRTTAVYLSSIYLSVYLSILQYLHSKCSLYFKVFLHEGAVTVLLEQ